MHSNTAKKCGEIKRRQKNWLILSIRMLYEFYAAQKIKKPGSIDAAYLLDGVPRTPEELSANGHQQHGEEMHVQSSPYMSSSIPHQEDQVEAVPWRSIVLAKEEDLEGEMGMQFMGLVSLRSLKCPLLKTILAAKAKFKQIHSIHIHSLGPSKVQVSQRSLSIVSTMPIVIESSNPVRLQQSDNCDIRE